LPKIVLSPEIQADYDFSANTFISKDKEPEVEVGDIKQADFQPQVKIKRWGNEANFSIRLLDTAPGPASVTVDKEKVVWAKGDREARFYAQGFGMDNGAFELEVILLAKPTSNVITFSIQSKLLKFYHQSPLTAEEIASGHSRPESVVGSYAVYHATKENAHPSKAEADKYKAGKAFHIYRPRVTDALGAQVWADLNIAGGMLTITIDQRWLDAAVYPVVIDPNFGYETAGSSTTAQGVNWMIGALFTSPGDAATGNSLTFSADTGVSANGKGVIVAHGDSTILTNGVGDAVAISASKDWNTSTFGTDPTLSGSTAYVLLFVFDASWRVYYDSGDTDQGHFDGSNSYASPTDPSLSHLNNKYSIYCTYTAAGGETRSLAGSQPAATGVLTRIEQALRALAGDQPAATGTLTRIEQALRALAGDQPAASGTLTTVQSRTRPVAGDQPAATGVLTRIEKAVRALAGDQPNAIGALTRVEQALRALTGDQPAATGILSRVEQALRALTGSQPAATGTLTRTEKAVRALSGDQPSATGTLTYVFTAGPGVTIPQKGGGISVKVGVRLPDLPPARTLEPVAVAAVATFWSIATIDWVLAVEGELAGRAWVRAELSMRLDQDARRAVAVAALRGSGVVEWSVPRLQREIEEALDREREAEEGVLLEL
jgi:hypothetical protein